MRIDCNPPSLLPDGSGGPAGLGRHGPAGGRTGQRGSDPLLLQLALTNACNLSCTHCYRSSSRAFAKELDLSEVARVLWEFSALAASLGRPGGVAFSGGEPLLHPHLGLVARIARGLDLPVRVNTNATLINAQSAHSLASWGVQLVQVSLDGASPGAHESVRGPNSWSRAKSGVAALLEAGLEVVLKVTLLPGVNDADPRAYLHVAAQWGIEYVSFARVIQIGGCEQGLPAYDPLRYRQVLDRLAAATIGPVKCEVRDACFDRSYILGLPHRFRGEEGHNILAIDADGSCYVSRRLPLLLGNIRGCSVKSLWRHPAMQTIRKGQWKGKCSTCHLAPSCRAGSRAAAWAATGDLLAPDPACWVEVPDQAAQLRDQPGMRVSCRGSSLRLRRPFSALASLPESLCTRAASSTRRSRSPRLARKLLGESTMNFHGRTLVP